jgi:hypothetical protein
MGLHARPTSRQPTPLIAINYTWLQHDNLTKRRDTSSVPIPKRISRTVSCAWPLCRPSPWTASAATNICSGGKPAKLCLRWSRCAAASERRADQPFHFRFGDANEAPCPTSPGIPARSGILARHYQAETCRRSGASIKAEMMLIAHLLLTFYDEHQLQSGRPTGELPRASK